MDCEDNAGCVNEGGGEAEEVELSRSDDADKDDISDPGITTRSSSPGQLQGAHA